MLCDSGEGVSSRAARRAWGVQRCSPIAPRLRIREAHGERRSLRGRGRIGDTVHFSSEIPARAIPDSKGSREVQRSSREEEGLMLII